MYISFFMKPCLFICSCNTSTISQQEANPLLLQMFFPLNSIPKISSANTGTVAISVVHLDFRAYTFRKQENTLVWRRWWLTPFPLFQLCGSTGHQDTQNMSLFSWYYWHRVFEQLATKAIFLKTPGPPPSDLRMKVRVALPFHPTPTIMPTNRPSCITLH